MVSLSRPLVRLLKPWVEPAEVPVREAVIGTHCLHVFGEGSREERKNVVSLFGS